MSTPKTHITHLRITGNHWEDLRFPLTGRNIDVTSGRLGFNYYNGTVTFAANARFNLAETVSFTVQLPHGWKEGSILKPHFHWLQQHATNIPNWLMGYRIYSKSESNTALETDFSNMTLVIPDSHAFTYTSGVLEQITGFPDIDMTGQTISDTIHICLWRDSANDSGEFSGADPSSIVEHIREFDLHFMLDGFGSEQEYLKDNK